VEKTIEVCKEGIEEYCRKVFDNTTRKDCEEANITLADVDEAYILRGMEMGYEACLARIEATYKALEELKLKERIE